MVSLHSLIILFIAIQLLLQPAPAGDFLLLTPANKRVYDTWYDNEGPKAGLLSEDKVTMGLPRSILAKIWKLSDQGQDGKLDRYEFSIYHHLTRRAYYYSDEIPDQVVISPHSSYSIIILYIPPQLSREYLASISN